MKNYLVLVRGGGPGFAALDEDGQKNLYAAWGDYVGKLVEGGNWKMGNPLDDSGRLYCDQREAKEGVVGEDDVSVGGFMVLEAESYDSVVELCDACPSLDIGGKLEIREAIEM